MKKTYVPKKNTIEKSSVPQRKKLKREKNQNKVKTLWTKLLYINEKKEKRLLYLKEKTVEKDFCT